MGTRCVTRSYECAHFSLDEILLKTPYSPANPVPLY